MEVSEIVLKIKEKVEKDPISICDTEEKEESNLNETLVQKAFIKICEYWNKDEKSRGFIKHLAKSFVPVEGLEKLSSIGETEHLNGKDRCCILGIKLAGTKEITEAYDNFNSIKSLIDKKVVSEKRDKYSDKEEKKLNSLKKNMPVEVRNATIGYESSKSDKLLSGEASRALCLFLEEGALNGDKEIMYLVNPSSNKKTYYNKKPRNRSFGMKNFVDDETMNKLRNIKF